MCLHAYNIYLDKSTSTTPMRFWLRTWSRLQFIGPTVLALILGEDNIRNIGMSRQQRDTGSEASHVTHKPKQYIQSLKR